MTQHATILREFHDDLDRATDLLDFINRFKDFAGSNAPTGVSDGSVAWQEALELIGIAPKVRTDLPILSGSILLYVCGRFENFVRELVVAVADDCVAKATVYDDLPERVRKELRARTLDVAQTPGKYGYDAKDAERFLQTLANSFGTPSPTPVVIEARLLSITEANMNAGTLAEVFKRVEIEQLWHELGKQAPLKTHLVEAIDGQCASEAKSRLDAMMKERNAIAHPTGKFSFPGADQVAEACAFLRVLSQVLVDNALIPRT